MTAYFTLSRIGFESCVTMLLDSTQLKIVKRTNRKKRKIIVSVIKSIIYKLYFLFMTHILDTEHKNACVLKFI